MTEEWRPVPGWEGYFVSSLGRVRGRRGGVLSPTKSGRYYQVMLYPGRRTALVHRLVCEAFHGPAPEGRPLALHWNDDKHDNRPENLRWGTSSDNEHDKVRNGNHTNANKVVCKRGHPYTDENTYRLVQTSGTISRLCRTCQRMHDTERRPRKK